MGDGRFLRAKREWSCWRNGGHEAGPTITSSATKPKFDRLNPGAGKNKSGCHFKSRAVKPLTRGAEARGSSPRGLDSSRVLCPTRAPKVKAWPTCSREVLALWDLWQCGAWPGDL